MEKIIQSLLLENESVELPGLGVFKKRFRSSHIDADDTIHPPTSKPVFSVDKTVRGKDLVGALMNLWKKKEAIHSKVLEPCLSFLLAKLTSLQVRAATSS